MMLQLYRMDSALVSRSPSVSRSLFHAKKVDNNPEICSCDRYLSKTALLRRFILRPTKAISALVLSTATSIFARMSSTPDSTDILWICAVLLSRRRQV